MSPRGLAFTIVLTLCAASSPCRAVEGGAGSVVGSWFGYGVGHAVQGRYRATGWKFTVLDTSLAVGTLGLWAVASDPSPQRDALVLVGATSLIGSIASRVWQIMDVVDYTPPKVGQAALSLGAAPRDGKIAGLIQVQLALP